MKKLYSTLFASILAIAALGPSSAFAAADLDVYVQGTMGRTATLSISSNGITQTGTLGIGHTQTLARQSVTLVSISGQMVTVQVNGKLYAINGGTGAVSVSSASSFAGLGNAGVLIGVVGVAAALGGGGGSSSTTHH